MILYLVACILKRKLIVYRIFISSLIGTIYSVITPLFTIKYDFIIKVILSIIMVLIAYKNTSIRDYFANFFTFYMVTLLFGGTIIGLSFIFNIDLLNSLMYPNNLTVSLIAIIIIVITILTRSIYAYLRINGKINNCYYDISIDNLGVNKCVRGYLDTGNQLYCGLSPVIILEEDIFNELKCENNPIKRDLSVATINGLKKTKAYKIDEIEISQSNQHRYYSNVFAIKSDRKFKDYEILLHRDM